MLPNLFRGNPGNCCPLCKRGLRVTENNTVEFARSEEHSRNDRRARNGYFSYFILFDILRQDELERFYRLLGLLSHEEPMIQIVLMLCYLLTMLCCFLPLVVTFRITIIIATLDISLCSVFQQHLENLNSTIESSSL